jgi:hypothetical protein
MKHILGIVFLVVMSMALFGQESSENHSRRLILSGIQISGGLSHNMNYSQTFAQFQKLVPHSEVLTAHPYEGYHSWPTTYWTHTGVVGASLRFRLAEPGNRNAEKGPEFRLGIRYNGTSFHFLDAGRADPYRIDTLYNGQGDEIGHIDSVESKSYTMIYNSNQLQLDFSMIYTTTPHLRLALFGGIGVAGGISTRSWAEIRHRTSTYHAMNVESLGYNIHYHTFSEHAYHNNDESATGNTGGVVYLPMGLRFRPGESGSLAGLFQVFYELQPGIHWMHIQGSDPLVQTGINQRIGISLNW